MGNCSRREKPAGERIGHTGGTVKPAFGFIAVLLLLIAGCATEGAEGAAPAQESGDGSQGTALPQDSSAQNASGNQSNAAEPGTCVFQQVGFSCSSSPPHAYADSAGELKLDVDVENRFGAGVTVYSVLCTDASASEANPDYAMDMGGLELSPGESMRFGASPGPGEHPSIPCVDADGNPLVIEPGQEFLGTLVVWYNNENDLVHSTHRIESAAVVSRVSASP
jgi:hypothetical protein